MSTKESNPLDTPLSSLSEPIKSGFMTKQGAKRKNWNERWFVLKNGRLYYFKKRQLNEKPAGVIELKRAIIISYPSQKPSDDFKFNIVTPFRTWYLDTKSISECNEWMSVCRSVANVRSDDSFDDIPNNASDEVNSPYFHALLV